MLQYGGHVYKVLPVDVALQTNAIYGGTSGQQASQLLLQERGTMSIVFI